MSWKDNLLPASFRNVPFFVESSSHTTGRRTTQHEFPDRTIPFADDLGKISDTFAITGYIIGDDYFSVRNALKEAVNKEGPGELIHPYYGVQRVQAGSINFNETREDGRIVTFSITFKEAGDDRFPKGVNDKGAQLLENTSTALAAAEADFAGKYDTDNKPGFVLDDARASIASAQEAFNSATENVATVADGIAELAFSTRNLVAETEDLLQSPAKLANRLLNSLSLIRGAVTSALDAFSSFGSLFGFGDDDEEKIETTPSRQTIKQNKLVFDNYIKLTGAIRAAEDAAVADFTSLEAAQEARESLLAVFDEQLLTTDNDELYQAIKNVSATLVELLPDSDSDLPQVKEIGVQNTTNTLVLSYDLFENLNEEQDIIDRNDINHPGFVEAGSTLEIIDGRQSEN